MKTLIKAIVFFAGLSSSAAFACDVTFTGDIQPILNTSCVGCHQDASPGGDLSLQRSSAYASLVGAKASGHPTMPMVTAGNSKESYLVAKLQGTQIEVGGQGDQMPFGGVLTDAEMAAIITWIDDCDAAK